MAGDVKSEQFFFVRKQFMLRPFFEPNQLLFGFGGVLGGPVLKDKTFFFLNYQGDRFVTVLTNSAIVPTAAFKFLIAIGRLMVDRLRKSNQRYIDSMLFPLAGKD